MVRTWSIILGICLIILGAAGLNSPTGTWIAWLDIAGGVISFFVGATASGVAVPATAAGTVGRERRADTSGLFFICVGLFAMWIIGIANHNITARMAWWNFAFACAYGLIALSLSSKRGRMRRASVTTERPEEQGPRRVA
jgi:hypothetical protein